MKIKTKLSYRFSRRKKKYHSNKRLKNLTIDSSSEEGKEEQFLDVESISWTEDEWQIKILKPFFDSIGSQPYESEQVRILKDMMEIIEECFENINDFGWKVIVSSLKYLKLNKLSDEVFKLAYGVVESLVREYIDFIEGSNLLILISTIKRFA